MARHHELIPLSKVAAQIARVPEEQVIVYSTIQRMIENGESSPARMDPDGTPYYAPVQIEKLRRRISRYTAKYKDADRAAKTPPLAAPANVLPAGVGGHFSIKGLAEWLITHTEGKSTQELNRDIVNFYARRKAIETFLIEQMHQAITTAPGQSFEEWCGRHGLDPDDRILRRLDKVARYSPTPKDKISADTTLARSAGLLKERLQVEDAPQIADVRAALVAIRKVKAKQEAEAEDAEVEAT